MKSLYVAWIEPQTKSWFPVGKLTYNYDKHVYQFAYTKGAEKSPRFVPFGRMKDLHKHYFSTELFPLFANRLLSKSRPEYPAYLQWLNVQEQDNPLLLLARSGGKRATDSLEIFPSPERNEKGYYEFYFFSRELRHLATLERVNHLSQGEPLLLVPDTMALKTNDRLNVGYCPPYLLNNFWHEQMDSIDLTVAKLNRNAPLQFRLLCRLSFHLPEDFQVFGDEDFQVITRFPHSKD